MAATDPKRGQKDDYKGHEIGSEEHKAIDTLYHNESSFFSQVARLAFAEKGAEYRSRSMSIHGGHHEQLEGWFLKLNPKGEVPVLVTSEGKAVCGSLEIAKFVNDKPGTVNLTPKEHSLRNDKLVKAACSVDAHKLLQGHYINTNSIAKLRLHHDVEHIIEKLKHMKDNEEEDREVRKLAEAKLKDKEAMLKELEAEPSKMYDDAKPHLIEALDLAEKELSGEARDGPLLCGKDYTLADVVYTVLLARLHWAAPLEEELKSRPKLAEYWGVVKERPSFKEADVVDSVRLSFVASQLVEVVKDVAEEAAKATIRTSNSVGEFWNDKVVHPIVDSPTYKAMQMGVGVAVDQTGKFWDEKVSKPVSESDFGKAVAEKSHSAWEATAKAAHDAAEYAKEQAHKAAELAKEQAHKAQEAMKHHGENGEHKDETEEEKKKREEAHKEAHEKKEEDEKK